MFGLETCSTRTTPLNKISVSVSLALGGTIRGSQSEDLLHEGNVLPHLSLTRDGGNGTHLLLTKSVDDGRFTNVGVSSKPRESAYGQSAGRRTGATS